MGSATAVAPRLKSRAAVAPVARKLIRAAMARRRHAADQAANAAHPMKLHGQMRH